MKKIRMTFAVIFALLLSLTAFGGGASAWDMDLPSLYEAYSDYFLFGNIFEPNQLKLPEFEAMFKYYYNAMTAENAMKPNNISNQKDVYDFKNADYLVDWAIENDIFVHGHCLVWHAQSPRWLNEDAERNPLTREEAKVNLENFITTVAGHFAGRVDSWDVVNEAMTPSGAPGNWRESLRTDSPWYMAYENGMDEDAGEHPSDYIYDAFVFARLADPGTILYYLDFNEQEANKREAMAGMTEEFNERWKSDPRNTEPDRLLVEGLGLQAHYWTNSIRAVDVDVTIRRFIETGAVLSIAELDIPFGAHGTILKRETGELPTDTEYAKQANLYRDLFEVFVKHSEHIERVTIWGLADNFSWRRAGYPVLFDKDYQPKESFRAVLGVAEQEATLAAFAAQIESNKEDEQEEEGQEAEPVIAETAGEADDEATGLPKWLIPVIAAALLVIIVIIVCLILKRRK